MRHIRLSPIVLLVCATTLVRIVFAATTGLGVDESYMIAAGRVLCLGYFDHPPASWWLSRGAAELFGTAAPVAVRLPFILLFALSQLLMWRIGCLIAGSRAAFLAVVAFNLSPVFGVTTGSWVLPDGPLDTALLGAARCLLRALQADDRRVAPWIGAGLCAGLALFSKYTAVLPIGGAFLYLVTSPVHRHWLGRWQPYLSLGLALLVFSPVLVWNATHGWASFAFQGDRATGLRFHPLSPLTTFFGEALFVLPWIWVPMMVLFVGGFRRDAPWTHRLLMFLAAPPIIGFALISGWSSQRVLFHWAAPGYLMLFPLLGEAMARQLDRRWLRWLMGSTAVLVVVAMATISLQIQFDWLGGSLAAVMRKDPTEDGLDWTSVRDDLRSRGLLKPGTVAASLNWRDAGKFAYALGSDVTMLCLNRDSRQFGFADGVGGFAGRDVVVLLVGSADRDLEEVKRSFSSVEVLPGTAIRLKGRVLRKVTVIRGRGLKPDSQLHDS